MKLREPQKYLSEGKKNFYRSAKKNIYELFFVINLQPSWIASEMVLCVFRPRIVFALDGLA